MNKIISIGVFEKFTNRTDNLMSKVKFLRLSALFKATLHHTAAMLLFTDERAIFNAGFKDELCVLLSQFRSRHVFVGWHFRGSEGGQKRLYYMVAVNVC